MIPQELEEIRQAFIIEGAEMLTEMESALLALEADEADADEFGRLFRMVHTIKGSASIVGYGGVERFCHAIENILVRIREHELTFNRSLLLLLLTCHDHICTLMDYYYVNGDDEGAESPEQAALIGQLDSWGLSVTAGQQTKSSGMLDESWLSNVSGIELDGFAFFDEEVTTPPSELPMPVVGRDDLHAILPSLARNQQIVRVDAARIDQLSDLVVELVTASSVMESAVRRLGDISSTESATHVADLVKRIQEKTMSFRMIPIQSLFQRFRRIVHDIGSSSGKQILLQISGGDTELDKAVAEKLHEPLLHLVRNAIDHGIETAEERVVQGKTPTGTIHMQAFHDSGQIVLRISDDGQGINRERLSRKVSERRAAGGDMVPVGADLLSCIFEPGFSTCDDATMLSGRGIGMDVVKKTVESMRGKVDIESDEGVGTTFQISIPLSLSLVDGFMVSLGETLYILSMDVVLETLELPNAAERSTTPDGCLRIRDQLLPCLDLRDVLGSDEPVPSVRHVVVFKHGAGGVGLVVDRLLGEIKSVVKPLSHMYREVTCVSGASILGDGSIALYLETGKLVAESLKNGRRG